VVASTSPVAAESAFTQAKAATPVKKHFLFMKKISRCLFHLAM
jgi:hypothetical protein